MLRNYFKVALRNLINNKLYSFLNVGGLAVGISVCMLIMVYVAYDWSFDRFHKNAERIYYPGSDMKILGDESFYDGMSYKSGPILKSAEQFLYILFFCLVERRSENGIEQTFYDGHYTRGGAKIFWGFRSYRPHPAI